MTWTLNKGARSVDTEYGRVRVDANAGADVPELMARIAKLPDLETELRGFRELLSVVETSRLQLSERYESLRARVGRRECEHGIHLLSTCSVCDAKRAP